MIHGHADRGNKPGNPESDTEWEMSKSMSAGNVSYCSAKMGEWNGPREITKPIERQKEEDGKATTIAVGESEDSGRHSAEEEGEISLLIQSGNDENKNEV